MRNKYMKMFSFQSYLEIFTVLVLLHFAENACGDKVLIQELSDDWRLSNQNGTINLPVANIPSGVYSALSERYGDVLQSYNDVNLRWIALDNWTYTKTFNVRMTSLLSVRCVNLTLHGIDTVAVVRLNGQIIGHTNNMFVRYSYDVKIILEEENILEIQIKSPIHAAMELAESIKATNLTEPRPNCEANQETECYRNMLRKMQLSFGGNTFPNVPSMGIWKPVTLEFFEVAIMRDVDVALRRTGRHWILDIRAFLSVGLEENFYGELTIYAPNFFETPLNASRFLINATRPVIEFQQRIPANDVDLWWPNGFGAQTLYPMHFTANCWIGEDGPKLRLRSKSSKSLQIGFRTVELVEEEVATGNTFLFKVNGVEIFMKGAIYMPAHILPELSSNETRVRHLLQSAKDAHMNMLRIYGGGLYESDIFYELADNFGLFIWQDMAFTSATYPVTEEFLESVRLETRQNTQRLAYHPSLALIATNDETELVLAKNTYNTLENITEYTREYKKLFADTIREELIATVGRNNTKRLTVFMSTPSNGMLEQPGEISANPQNPDYGDVHVVDLKEEKWNPDSYPRPRFVSKYGFPSLPINLTWQQTLGPLDKLVDLIKHRQNFMDDTNMLNSFIAKYLPKLNTSAPDYMATLIYFSQLSQALTTKMATELFRSQRNTEHKTMGALYWQLNDIWVAPTWSILDYNGNYKLTYYWSKEFLAPTAIMALYDSKTNAINITYVRDDINVDPEVFNVTMNIYLWTELYPKDTLTWQAILRQNDTQLKQLVLDRIYTDTLTPNNCFLEFLLSSSNQIISRTFFYQGSFINTSGISDPNIHYYIKTDFCNEDSKIVSYSLSIQIIRPALFIYIEVNHPQIKSYRLSHNGFIQVVPIQIVQLEFEKKTKCFKLTDENIKIMTLNQFISAPKDDDSGVVKTTVAETVVTENDVAIA